MTLHSWTGEQFTAFRSRNRTNGSPSGFGSVSDRYPRRSQRPRATAPCVRFPRVQSGLAPIMRTVLPGALAHILMVFIVRGRDDCFPSGVNSTSTIGEMPALSSMICGARLPRDRREPSVTLELAAAAHDGWQHDYVPASCPSPCPSRESLDFHAVRCNEDAAAVSCRRRRPPATNSLLSRRARFPPSCGPLLGEISTARA